VTDFRPAAGTRRERVLATARTLRSPNSGLLGQGVRFLLAGGIVVVVYVTTTTVLANVVGLHFQVALLIGFGVAMLVQFNLYRVFVWVHHEEFALPMHHQLGRYVAAAGVNYGLTAVATAVLPGVLGVPTEAVYLVMVAALPVMNFVLLRYVIFHAKAPAGEHPPAPPPAPIAKKEA
jgi:putative flippase GtrA